MSILLSRRLLMGMLLGCLSFLPKGYPQADSLVALAPTLPDNEEKAEVYKNIAFSYYYADPDKCLAYCDSLQLLSQKIAYEKGLSGHLYLRSLAYYSKDDYEQAIDNCKLAIENMHTYGQQTNELIALDFLGSIYREMGWPEEAIDYKLQSLRLAEELKDTIGLAYAHYNLSTVFIDLKDTVSVKKHLAAAIPLAEYTQDFGLLSLCYSTNARYQTNAEQWLGQLQQAMEYARRTGSDYNEIPIHQNLADYYDMEGNPRRAIYYSRRAYKIATSYDDGYFIAESAISLGDFYIQTGRFDSAQYFLEEALAISQAGDFGKQLLNTYAFLGELYHERSDHQQAYSYLSKAYDLQDSLYSDEITQQIQTNAAKYEFEKNQRIISQQELTISRANYNRKLLLYGGLLLLAIITSAYQWYLRRQQKQKQQAELAFTQQQAEANRLRELDELKTNFFTNISHELRTPLTLILSPLTDIEEQIKSVPVREKLGIIKSNAQRLLRLVNEIMDLAKAEAGKLELALSKLRLQDLIKRIFYSFESLAELRQIQLELQYETGESTVLADREKLEKILHNLISNAIKFTASGGKVVLRVTQKDAQFHFEVRDNGQGIPPEDLPRVFDRFYQVKFGRLQGGTGIGLALSKELAETMQGTLSAKSEIGQGSTFILSLPLKEVEASKPLSTTPLTEQEVGVEIAVSKKSTVPAYLPTHIAEEKPRILVVEDNPDLGKYLMEVLSEYFQCVWARDGQEALRHLSLNNFDCITSDVMMPNMDGFELRAAINQRESWKQIPFLMLTARNLEEDKIRGFQMGIDDYVTKPFSTRELKARIQNLITNKWEREAFAKKESEEPEVSPLTVDQQFLKQAESVVLENISDPQFGVEDLAKSVNYSSKQLGRLLKKYTGLNTVNFILEIRLQKARELLEKRLCASVTEAQFEVGISSTSYFTRKFTERFGKNPSAIG